MNDLKTLFHFESEVFSLVEIKHLLPNETDKSKLYFWLLFDKQKAKLQKLNFVSMTSDGEKEFRFFENGQLTFNKKNAILILDNNEFKLEVLSTDLELNMNIQQAIRQFTINLK